MMMLVKDGGVELRLLPTAKVQIKNETAKLFKLY